MIHSAQCCGASVSVPLAFQTDGSVSSGHEAASDHTEMASQKTARKARVQRKASGEQQRNQPAGLPYALLHGIECSRKKRWSVLHLPEMGARQIRHGLQHATQAFGLTSNSSGVVVVILTQRCASFGGRLQGKRRTKHTDCGELKHRCQPFLAGCCLRSKASASDLSSRASISSARRSASRRSSSKQPSPRHGLSRSG